MKNPNDQPLLQQETTQELRNDVLCNLANAPIPNHVSAYFEKVFEILSANQKEEGR